MVFCMGAIMVRSSVEYIDKDVEAAATDDEDRQEPVAWEVAAILKLLIPILSTLFVIFYLNSVIGRIGISNLYYPLFVIGALFTLLVTVYIEELLSIYRLSKEYTVSMRSELVSIFEEWKQSIGLLVVSLVYLYLIPILGFFPASFLAMVIIMPLGGYRDWRVIIATAVGILALIYGLFVVVANLQPPAGVLL